MLADLYQFARHAKAPPSGWPAPELASWARAALAGAVAPGEAAALSVRWTHWESLVLPDTGQPESGTWGDLCAWLGNWSGQRVHAKEDARPWAPGLFDRGRRSKDAAVALYAVALDCDDWGDWRELLAELGTAGLAYFAHRTPSHCEDGDGPCKWRLVLPLAAPLDLAADGGRDRWRDAYHLARLCLGALGGCWFDHACADTGRGWFPPVAVGDAPPRELAARGGYPLDLAALVRSAPVADRARAVPAPRLTPRPHGVAGDRVERARRWIATRDPAVQGQCGDAWTFATVAQLVNDFALTDVEALDVLTKWNATCRPPWHEAGLRAKIASAHRSGSHAKGAALDAPAPPLREPHNPPEAPSGGDPPPPANSPLARSVGELGWLDHDPPPLACLLSCEARNGARSPFLALGKVGLLAAPGGVGKTQALLQLAIAVASGRPWLGRYHVEAPGPVLLLAAEEDGGELWRRCRRVVERLDLTAAERDALARRLQVAPLHGSGTPLTLLENLAPYGPVRLERSAMWERIAAQLKARGPEPWRLVVLDPAARWMPPDAEKDSKVATTFVEAVEQLAQLAPEGAAPAVLVAHHTNKAALTGQTDQGAARGSSALTDGVRWQANLDRVVVENVLLPGHARLRLVKCNYAPAQAFDPLELSFTEGGVLVPADFAAEQEPKQPKQQKRAKLTAKSGHDKAAGGDNENTW